MTQETAKPKMIQPKPRFRVGQVVRIDTEWYRRGEGKGQQYQRIVRIYNWADITRYPFGYDFLNGDSANEKYVRPLTKREIANV
jgi:hypothetical protein